MKKVFIIILNWNGKEFILKCLESVRKLKTGPPAGGWKLEIVVVDNGSTDNSVNLINEFIKKYSYEFVSGPGDLVREKVVSGPPIRVNSRKLTIRLIENRVNLGFAEGNNVGIRYALKNGADFILILNPDTIVDKDLIVQLISAQVGSAAGGKVASSNDQIGILGPKIYFAPGFEYHKEKYKASERGKVIFYAGGEIDWDNILASHRGVDEVDKGQYDQIEETDFVSGCAMLVRREVFEKIGLFDPKYFLYWEDADFCERVRRAGFKILYAPEGKVWHLDAGSSKVGGPLHDYFLTRNRFLFGMRYAPLRVKLALWRESFKIFFSGRQWQKIAVRDFYLGRFGKGSWK